MAKRPTKPTKSVEPRRAGRGPSPEKTAQTRRVIIDAALGEFLENGYADTTMDGVARRAGVAKGTSYRYFPAKEALFEAVVREKIAGALIDADPANRRPDEPVSTFIRRTMLVSIREIERNGRAAIARLVLVEGARFPEMTEIYRRAMFEPLLKQIRDLAATARARGELRRPELEDYPHLLIAPIWFAIIHNGLLDRAHPLDIGDLFEAHLDLVFDA
ncbi:MULTISPECIES: TetR/AcrR family transcriptional regulator [unclassified Methylosinus]|uniref:TetR/AcrR family transcriptional regulator n=1 Tax=unclassified Methylosinus TaxID=2624500 RepID=UPI0004B8BCE5|nr:MULTISPECIES: TetR/AcrR family transcriptional regulator [unclassified Methylosinus]